MPTVYATLPAYNEEKSLPPLLTNFAELGLPDGWDLKVLIVNDGSSDKTSEVAKSFCDRLELEVVEHPENRGLGAAIKTGLHEAIQRAADDDVIVCMDADDTHHPKYVHDMLEKLDEGADLVIASRYQKGSKQMGVPPHRLLYSLGARMLFALTLRLPGVRDYTCGYRAYRVPLVQRGFDEWGEKLIEGEGFACTDELLVKLARLEPTPSVREIPFVLRYDLKQGASKLPLFQTIWGTLLLCFRGGKH